MDLDCLVIYLKSYKIFLVYVSLETDFKLGFLKKHMIRTNVDVANSNCFF